MTKGGTLAIGCALLALGRSAAAAPELRPAPARTSFIAASSLPRASGSLSADEKAALSAGEIVARPMAFDKNGNRYVGGVSYQLVHALPDEVLNAVLNVDELPHLLPRTRSARLLDAGGQRARVELTQGNSVVQATYTVELERTGPGEVRFRLDPSRPHGIADVWGYFRARPFGENRTLITVAVALDVGPGLVRMLFEDKIQRIALETPRYIKDWVEPRALALR